MTATFRATANAEPFNPNCRRCPRLAHFLDEVRRKHPDYHAAPVPAFGPDKPALLIVGLAPGMHGANATGRPFTGDHAGGILYRNLHAFGFSNAPVSLSANDGLRLKNCKITNAVKCLPPQNKPDSKEVGNCISYLRAELPDARIILALGQLAHNAVLKTLGLVRSQWKFAHAAEHPLPNGQILLDSYHCSRYNTQTRRLTEDMFSAIFQRARHLTDEL